MEKSNNHVSTHQTKTGIAIQYAGDIIETYNKSGRLIHAIDTKEALNKIIIHRWFGSATDEEVKEIFDKHFFEFLQAGGHTKIIVDTSRMNGFFDGVNNWLAEYFIPKLLTIGVKHNAFLVSEDFYADMGGDDLDEGVQSMFVTRIFDSEEKALKWLRAVN
jgi:hypothetical protein